MHGYQNSRHAACRSCPGGTPGDIQDAVQADAEGLSAGVIGERLQIPASTLSFHLKELNRAGLIHARQVSRFIYYSASYDTMNALLTYLTDNCCAGTQHCITAVTCDPAKGKCCE